MDNEFESQECDIIETDWKKNQKNSLNEPTVISLIFVIDDKNNVYYTNKIITDRKDKSREIYYERIKTKAYPQKKAAEEQKIRNYTQILEIYDTDGSSRLNAVFDPVSNAGEVTLKGAVKKYTLTRKGFIKLIEAYDAEIKNPNKQADDKILDNTDFVQHFRYGDAMIRNIILVRRRVDGRFWFECRG